ncbi:STY0301 family protein [Massilia horti]|nr:STY0301 family protein [Massilia horti]
MLLCVLFSGVARAGQRIACPMMVDVRQVTVESPAGWTGIYGPSGTRPLLGAEAIFTTGSLRDSWGELRDPPTVKKKGGAVIETKYPLPPERELGKWIICHYGESLYQAMKLPTATKECAVTYNREYTDSASKKPVYRVADITCK